MQVELSYGHGTLPVLLPEGVRATVIRKPAMPAYPDPAAAVAAALEAPIEALPLEKEARGKRTACILICDITRPVPNGLILPAVLRALFAAGLAKEDVTVLVATGLHRPNLGAELSELVGDPFVEKNVRVLNHDARDDAAHLDLGQTPLGTPVKLDRRFALADLKIVTGLVEPHFMAGYSGGRKVIAPGVAHRETITTFHSSRFMAHPRADNCVLEGNPLHEEQLAIARLLGRVLSVNAVIDEARRLSHVSYGELKASHAAAVAFVEAYARVGVPRRFRTVLTSGAGYPLDKTYYQTVKGMVAPKDILLPDSDLVICSECSEGMGSREYVAAQERFMRLGPDGFLADIAEKRFADVDEWQTQMQVKPMRLARVHLYSDRLAARDQSLTGVEVVSSAAQAVAESVRRTGDPEVAVIPEGPYVVPFFAPAGPP
ncbi:MAG TPA: nickel-dependent lactate racemase [Anaeromyxobacteraceae bacterium]|nr:nickel-dependent lactate racemase [Anaeromyxobacteraceae bacterium]